MKKVAVVIGGTGDIGKCVVESLLLENFHVVIASNEDSLKVSPYIENFFVDVTIEKSVIDLFENVDKKFKKIDVMINCSGIGVFKPIEELTAMDWNSVMNVNVTGAFLCAREAYVRMKKEGGRIIHIGSISDHVPLINNAVYGSSKFALRGFTKIINEEGKKYNIRASLISLGAVDTKIWDDKAFDRTKMLAAVDVATFICDIIKKPLNIRIDEIKLFPSEGVL
jgi:NAD(P)-dependent dehydrogenase (short-subunit alcohol dehydrogenase family)